jgi:two-component system response regulator YesN
MKDMVSSMNLLIVEDERMTREGLMKSLDWPNSGISKVLCAENGETGLSMAKRIMPDIVLTDIRMPRMDGITMAGHIREILPECRIVFLSAYSEIDYYKAAIDLKAIHYLDKPIDEARLQAVISEAVAECTQLRLYKSNHDLHHMQKIQKLADAICMGEDEGALENGFKELSPRLDFKSRDYCTAVVVSLRLDYEDEVQENLLSLASVLSGAVIYPNLFTIRQGHRITLLLFTPAELSSNHIALTCKKLQGLLVGYTYMIVAGRTFRGLKNANKSYITAKAALGKAWLRPWGQVICYGEDAEKIADLSSYDEEKNLILDNLSGSYEKETLGACENLYQKLKERQDLAYPVVRELYFEVISEVFHKADSLFLNIREEDTGEMISWIVRIEKYNLDELHEFLCRQVTQFYISLEESRNEKKQILAIRDFIAKRYTDDTFSIGDISAFLHMSVSHVCTMFKKETGDTINNYLTEYRLNKAKQYLRETLLTAAEIGARVGYKDGSYFGRIFRKRFGLTPNEFRNR